MPIRAVCFDLGKVLLDFDKETMLVRMAERCPFSVEEITRLFRADPQGIAYEMGHMSTHEYFYHLKWLLEFTGTEAELQRLYSEIFTPLPAHIALAKKLAAHYPLAIISNTNDAHIAYAEATYPFFSHFSARIYSHQVKAMKPERSIYDAALTALGSIAPEDALFIDDLEANIVGASSIGWKTIHLLPEVDLRSALKSFDLRGLD